MIIKASYGGTVWNNSTMEGVLKGSEVCFALKLNNLAVRTLYTQDVRGTENKQPWEQWKKNINKVLMLSEVARIFLLSGGTRLRMRVTFCKRQPIPNPFFWINFLRLI